MELSDAAKEEIREAIRIVREDRFEEFVRSNMRQREPQSPPSQTQMQTQEPTTQPTEPTEPQKSKTPPPKPPSEPQPKKVGLWGNYAED